MLRAAKNTNILLWKEDNDLKMKFRKGDPLDQHLLQELKSNKEDILKYLEELETSNSARASLLKTIAAPCMPVKWQKHYNVMHQQKKEYLRFLIVGKNTSHLRFTVRYKNPDKKILENVISTIYKRHESLRTSFLQVNGDIKQKVHRYRKARFEVAYINLTAMDQREIPALVEKELSSISFDFEKGPLANVKVIELPEEMSVLVFTMHHVIADGGSIEVLKREIHMLYEAYSRKERNPLPRLALQYKDYSEWINKIINSPEGRACWMLYQQSITDSLLQERDEGSMRYDMGRSYKAELENEMKMTLKGKGISEYPDAYGTIVTLAPGAGASYTLFVEDVLSNQLRSLSTQCNVSLFVTLIAAFVKLFHTPAKENVRVSIPFSTRVSPEFEQMVGWLTHNLIVCFEVDENMGIAEFVRRVNDSVWESSDFRFYPHEKMMEDLDLPLNRLAPVYINLLKATDYQIKDFRPYHSDKGTGVLDLKCLINECKNGIAIKIHYNIEKFSREEIGQIGSRYLFILEQMASDSGLSLKSI